MIVQRLLDAIRGWWPPRTRLLAPADHRRILSAARREQHGGLAALYLAGTPYEMGYQHGELARDLVHGFRQAAYDYVLPQVPGPDWLARPLLFQHTSTYWRTVFPEYAEEMRGIADGAGVHPVEVLISTAIWEIFHAHGCSQFAVVDAGSEGDSLLHGYNYDLMDPEHALIQPYLAAIFYRPSRGIPFVTLNTAGSVGVNGGMNEAGISVAWDNTYLRDTGLTAGLPVRVVPFILTLRHLLQYAATLKEAVAIVTDSLPRPLADTVIIASAREGRAVALETAGREYAVRNPVRGAVWSTNCFQSPKLAAHDQRGDGRGLSDAERWRRFPRSSAYAELFGSRQDPFTAQTAACFLRDPYPREKAGYRHPMRALRTTICRDITSWSLVMEPGAGRLWASDTQLPACQGRFHAFDLREWKRLEHLDIPATGYQAAVRGAERLLAGDRGQCLAALDEVVQLDGVSAPLQLMQALVFGLQGSQSQASQMLQEIEANWPGTPAAVLADSWLGGSVTSPVQSIPFPSAIRPLLQLTAGTNWEDRAVPVQS